MRHLQQVMCQRFAQSPRVLFQVLRIRRKRRDPIVVPISLPGCDRTDNVRSKRLTSHSTTEFGPKAAV
jgi:hypothetical protein